MGMYVIALAILFIGILTVSFIKKELKMEICAVVLGLCTVFLFLPSINVLFTGQPVVSSVYIPPILGEVNFVIDQLSAFFVIVVSLMSFIGSVYAIGYIRPYQNKDISAHCVFFLTLIASMLLVVTVQNALFFIIVWELMSLSSFFLVIFENEKKEVIKAGIKYLVYMHLSILFIIAAFAILNIYSDSFNFADFSLVLKGNPALADIVFLLAFTGFGIKSGFVPFHNWLPEAHPVAPSHISGIMSGVMIKTGIYGILRMLYLLGIPSKIIAYTVLFVSIITALWGVLYAISKHDIKHLLACSSIENAGIIGIGIGIGLLGLIYQNPLMAVFGFSGAILHILNHSVFKELLFFAAGSVYLKTHTKDVELLGGLIKKMPYTAVFFIIGSIAICAFPPFNGFISELLIYAGMILGLGSKNSAVFMPLIVSLASLALIGTMAILCFSKVTGIMFLGTPRSEHSENVKDDVEKTMLVPMGILSIIALVIGLYPQNVLMLVLSPVSMFIKIPEAFYKISEFSAAISSLCVNLAIVLLSVYIIRNFINKKSRKHSTWGCGYNRVTSRIQYTASSYADLFVSTLKPLFKRIIHIKKPKEIFPKEAYYEVDIQDIEEAYIVNPMIKLDEKFLSNFEKMQNGNMQQYILWGLLFLVISVIGLIYFG